jgi:DNA-binding transcriptional LysR family regulator
VPRAPEDLVGHNCLRLLDYEELARWPFKSAGGEIRGQRAANNAETVLQMGVVGLGITLAAPGTVSVKRAASQSADGS